MNSTVSGTVTDSFSGRPVPLVLVAVSGARKGRVATDVGGRFMIKNVNPGIVQLEFHAPSQTMLGRPIGTKQVVVAAEASVVVDFQFDTMAYKERPCQSTTGEFRGLFSWGLELSEFIPEGNRLLLPGGVRLHARAIWVEMADLLKRFPETYVEYRVRWIATVTGPGMYSHFGVSDYQMSVHQVIEVEALPMEEEREPIIPRRTVILLIDESADVRGVLREALESEGYRVLDAANAREGLRLFRLRRPTLAIIDLVIPENAGIETVRQMLIFDSDAVIFTMNGTDDASDPDEVARMLGARCGFRKPINVSDLLVAIDKWIW